MRYSTNFTRDWLFLLLNMRKFKFSGVGLLTFPHDADGVDGKRAYHAFDSQGRLLPTRHPRLTAQALNCKRSINFHVKLWAEGYSDCLISRTEYLQEFRGDIPEWVETAFSNQRYKADRMVCHAGRSNGT